MHQINKKEEIRRIKEQKLHRMLNEQYRYYYPNERIETFIRAFGEGKFFVINLSAANGVGKTFGTINLLCNLFWPVGNPFFDYPMFKEWPYPKVGRIVSDPTTITDTIVPKLQEIFPKNRYGKKRYVDLKNGKRYASQWETDTGWTFDVMTYEQSPKEFESKTVGLIWMDEPPPQTIYKACVSRTRMGGQIMITQTPLTGSAWMYDSFLTSEDAVHL